MEGVGAELLDRCGDTDGEADLIDQAEAAVADDAIGGEIACEGEELGHGNPFKRGMEGGALAKGEGVEASKLKYGKFPLEVGSPSHMAGLGMGEI